MSSLSCSLPATIASALARSVFIPIASLAQQLATDWIAIIIPRGWPCKIVIFSSLLEVSVKKEEISKTIAVGSERIKNLLSSDNDMVNARVMLSSDLMEMMTSPLSCQVVQKLLS